jgi:hypothetical protein
MLAEDDDFDVSQRDDAIQARVCGPVDLICRGGNEGGGGGGVVRKAKGDREFKDAVCVL